MNYQIIECPYCRIALYYANSYVHIQQCLINRFPSIHSHNTPIKFINESYQLQPQEVQLQQLQLQTYITIPNHFEYVIQSIQQYNSSSSSSYSSLPHSTTTSTHYQSQTLYQTPTNTSISQFNSSSSSSSNNCLFSKLPELLIQKIYNLLPEDADRIALYYASKYLYQRKHLLELVEPFHFTSNNIETYNRVSLFDCYQAIAVRNLNDLYIILNTLRRSIYQPTPKLKTLQVSGLVGIGDNEWSRVFPALPPYVERLTIIGSLNNQTTIAIPPNLKKFSIENERSYQSTVKLLSSSITPNLTFLELTIPLDDPSCLAYTNITSLMLCNTSKLQQFTEGSLPPYLESLVIGDGSGYKKPMQPNCLPKTLKSLRFGEQCQFNQSIPVGCLPVGLETLVFDPLSHYDQPFLPNQLPHTLTSLTIADQSRFQQPLEHLPRGLKKLLMLYNMYYPDYPVQYGTLPPSLELIQFWDGFNQPLTPGLLPPTLKSITFGTRFNHPLSNLSNLQSLKSISFVDQSQFRHPILPGQLPNSLEELEFQSSYDLEFNEGVLSVLPKLGKLILPNMYNYPFKLNTFPPSLTNLHISSVKYNQPIVHLPPRLERLSLGPLFNQPLDQIQLPDTLEHLSIRQSVYFNQPIKKNSLPPRLKTLALPSSFKHRLEKGVLPSSIEFLYHYSKQSFESYGVPHDITSLRNIYAPVYAAKDHLPPWITFHEINST